MSIAFGLIEDGVADIDRKAKEDFLSQFKDIRGRMVLLQGEGVDIAPIAKKMSEARPLLECGNYARVEVIRNKCDWMLQEYANSRELFDKIEQLKSTLKKSSGSLQSLDDCFYILEQAENLVYLGDRANGNILLKEIATLIRERERAHEDAFELLLRGQRLTMEAVEIKLDPSQHYRTMKRTVESLHRQEYDDIIGTFLPELFEMRRKIWQEKAKRECALRREEMEKAKKQGVKVGEDENLLGELCALLKEDASAQFSILNTAIKNNVDYIVGLHKEILEHSVELGENVKALGENGFEDVCVSEIFNEVVDCINQGDYGFAIQSLKYIQPRVKKMVRLAEKQGISLIKNRAEKLLVSVNKALNALDKLKYDTTNFWAEFNKSKKHFNGGNFGQVIELLMPLEKELKNLKYKVESEMEKKYSSIFKEVQKRLLLLKQEDVGMDNLKELLEKCRIPVENGDWYQAVNIVKKIDSRLKNMLDNLEALKKVLPQCSEMYSNFVDKPGYDWVEKEYLEISSARSDGQITEALDHARNFISRLSSATTPQDSLPLDQVKGDYSQPQMVTQHFGENQYYQYGGNYQENYGVNQGVNYGGYADNIGVTTGATQYYCSKCQNILRYITQYNEWWCDTCERYEGE